MEKWVPYFVFGVFGLLVAAVHVYQVWSGEVMWNRVSLLPIFVLVAHGCYYSHNGLKLRKRGRSETPN